MQHLNDNNNAKVEGHIKIVDPESGEVFVNKRNAINFENMSKALAFSLAGLTDSSNREYSLLHMAFGNGGVSVTGTGALSYRSTNTGTASGTLYNQTFQKNISNSVEADAENSVQVAHTGGNTYSDIIITCTLGYNEPAGQDALDNATTTDGTYVFDELGLKIGTSDFISHVIFHPVQKSANRKIQVIYTVRITAGS